MAFDLDRHSLARTNCTPSSSAHAEPSKPVSTSSRSSRGTNRPTTRSQTSASATAAQIAHTVSMIATLRAPQHNIGEKPPFFPLSLPNLQARAEQGKNVATLSGLGKTDGGEVRWMVHATRSVRSGGQPLMPDFYDACGAVTSRDSHLDVLE